MNLLQHRKKSLDPFVLKVGGHFLLESVTGLNRIPNRIVRNRKMGDRGHVASVVRGTALLVESQTIFA